MPTLYTNTLTGPIVMSSGGVPLTDVQTQQPVAYINSTIRAVVPVTGVGGNTQAVAITLPQNFIAFPALSVFHLQGALAGAPQGVSVAVGVAAGGATLVASVAFTADQALSPTWLTLGQQYLIGEVANNPKGGRTIYVTPTATTTGAGTSRIYVYLPGIYVDINDIPVNA